MVRLKREILGDGTEIRMKGSEIVSQENARPDSVDLKTFTEIFRADLVPEEWKQKADGKTVFIFCTETFPTPHCSDGDESVLYFCWMESTQSWYSTYWRINDTWNVVCAILRYEKGSPS